jgi:hypothetical protein
MLAEIFMLKLEAAARTAKEAPRGRDTMTDHADAVGQRGGARGG